MTDQTKSAEAALRGVIGSLSREALNHLGRDESGELKSRLLETVHMLHSLKDVVEQALPLISRLPEDEEREQCIGMMEANMYRANRVLTGNVTSTGAINDLADGMDKVVDLVERLKGRRQEMEQEMCGDCEILNFDDPIH